MIVVTGATGRVGSKLLEALVDQAAPVRALVRREKACLPPGCECVPADLDAPESLSKGLDGASALFLCSPQDPRQAQRELAAIAAARAAGVGHIVKLSGGSAMVGPDSPSPVGRAHAEVEEALASWTGGWSVLRPSAFMQVVVAPLVDQARNAGQVLLPIGDARVAFVDVADIAAAATWALLHPAAAHGRALEITGPEALALADLAQLIGARLARPVAAVAPPLQAAEPMIRARIGDPFLQAHQLAMLELMGQGRLSRVSSDFQSVVGRPPRSVASWLTTVA